MRCNDFDVHIDEMLSGILHPDANQHMHQCERCNSHFRARVMVQNGLHKLASTAVSGSKSGPSRATNRKVMESFRRLQQHRADAWNSVTASASVPLSEAPAARLFTFPSRSLAPAWASRTWWTGAAAAAVVFAVMGSAVHLWTDVPTVNAPIVASSPSVPTTQPGASLGSRDSRSQNGSENNAVRNGVRDNATANAGLRHGLTRPAALSPQGVSQSNASQPAVSLPEVAAAGLHSTPADSPTAKSTSTRPAIAYSEASNYDSGPVTHLPSNIAPVIRLASTGAASNVAQSASSTWPGYSNLMYCDPVVCSGPMQVVHIKVPVGQVKPNLGQTVGNAFVNAEVVIGPDGVARAIRVAN
jgi:hypothetical protein